MHFLWFDSVYAIKIGDFKIEKMAKFGLKLEDLGIFVKSRKSANLLSEKKFRLYFTFSPAAETMKRYFDDTVTKPQDSTR